MAKRVFYDDDARQRVLGGAKALYDANYEDDRVTIVQALVLMGWYWEGPEGMFVVCPRRCRRVLALTRILTHDRRYKECFLLDTCSHCRSSRFWNAPQVSLSECNCLFLLR